VIMVTKFVCVVADCPNVDVEYLLSEALPITTCGGCGIVLNGVVVNE
jgi:hypothetical protein